MRLCSDRGQYRRCRTILRSLKSIGQTNSDGMTCATVADAMSAIWAACVMYSVLNGRIIMKRRS